MAQRQLIKFELTGLKGLLETLEEMGNAVAKGGMQRASVAGGLILRDAIRDSFPQGPPRSEKGKVPAIDRGYLKRAIILFRRRENETVTKAVYTVAVKDSPKEAKRARRRKENSSGAAGEHKNVAGPGIYGKFLEFGTSKMEARPFVKPAYFNNEQRMVRTIKSKLKEAIIEGLRSRRSYTK